MTSKTSPRTPFPNQPVGTVTFLFTDIEGSTRLLYDLGERYVKLLRDHHKILRTAFSNWKGYEVDTQGDSFFVAFARATQALSAVVEAQRKLVEHAWPENVKVRVRMGIHTGEPWSGETGYVGMVVHRAARIANLGHGNQVLLSESSTALVQDELPTGVRLLDLGSYVLKDIHRPEHVYQLVIEGLPAEFPPLKSHKASPSEKKIFGVLEILQSQDPTRIHERIDIINAVTHLGRKADNDLSFSRDSSVSRHHAILKVRDEKIYLGEVALTDEETGQPCRPTYGTFLNGLQVQEPIELLDGDEIALGTSLSFRFEAVNIKPDNKKDILEIADPCADSKTTNIPKAELISSTKTVIVPKIARNGDRMPTSAEVREAISRIKSKTKAPDSPNKPKSDGDS